MSQNEVTTGKPIQFCYHAGIPGRGEYVRIVLEDAGIPYVDVAYAKGDGGASVRNGCSAFAPEPESLTVARPFAPPYIVLEDGTALFQTTSLIMYVGELAGLVPPDAIGRAKVNQMLLTIADVTNECHDTHHPVGSHLFYEDQKDEAKKRAGGFCSVRMPKFLHFFDETCRANGGVFLLGPECSAADVCLTHLMLGLEYAFPRAYARAIKSTPTLIQLVERVKTRPRLATYLKSTRRPSFNENGIFRRYPELDMSDE